MQYQRTVKLKDGRECVLRNGTAADAQAVLDVFNLTHFETDFLGSYPEESTLTPEGEADFLYDDGTEIVRAGECQYCPKGHWHSMRNNSDKDIVYFAVIPKQ